MGFTAASPITQNLLTGKPGLLRKGQNGPPFRRSQKTSETQEDGGAYKSPAEDLRGRKVDTLPTNGDGPGLLLLYPGVDVLLR